MLSFITRIRYIEVRSELIEKHKCYMIKPMKHRHPQQWEIYDMERIIVSFGVYARVNFTFEKG